MSITSILTFSLLSHAAGPEWPCFAGGVERPSISFTGPASIASPAWTCSVDSSGNTISFVGQSSPAVSRDHVLAIGSISPGGGKQWRLWAIDRRSGQIAWSAPVAAPVLDSWSSPAVDAGNVSAIVATGSAVMSFNLTTGAVRWTTPLDHPVVNASPVVTQGAGPRGLGLRDRVFITEYDGFGDDGRLTSINADPFDAHFNPHQPGEKLWSVRIGGSSGNSPAFFEGRVFVTTAGEFGSGPGKIMAFDAAKATEPEPLWTLESPDGEAFFSGIVAARDGSRISLYAATYAFFGNRLSSSLVKVDAFTGEFRWAAPCNRTASTPVLLPGGRIAVSGGLNGFGTIPTLQLFRDGTSSATLLWDSAASTWTDSNSNGVMDLGEYFRLGGWSVQPAVAWTPTARTLYLGVLPTSSSSTAANSTIYAIDADKLPELPGAALSGFVREQYSGAGSSAAIADRNLYTIGPAGLVAFGPPPPQVDVNADGRFDDEDLEAFRRGVGRRDVNLDGTVDSADLALLVESFEVEHSGESAISIGAQR